MSVIIRLQGLSWTASASDIRTFFKGLSIPPGGVHIIGGDQGDAFIAFTSDEDARQAMRRNNGYICDCPVQLLLSSKSEMQTVISEARSQSTSAPDQQSQQQQQPPAQAQQQQPFIQQQPPVSQQQNVNRQQPNFQQYPGQYPNSQGDMYQRGQPAQGQPGQGYDQPPQQGPPGQGYEAPPHQRPPNQGYDEPTSQQGQGSDGGFPPQNQGFQQGGESRQPPGNRIDYGRLQPGQPPNGQRIDQDRNDGNPQFGMPPFGQDTQDKPPENEPNHQGRNLRYDQPQDYNQYPPDQSTYPPTDRRQPPPGQQYPRQQGYDDMLSPQQSGVGNRGPLQRPPFGHDGRPHPDSRPDNRAAPENIPPGTLQPSPADQLYQDRPSSQPTRYDEGYGAQGYDESEQWYEEQQQQDPNYIDGPPQDQSYRDWPHPVERGADPRQPPVQRGPPNMLPNQREQQPYMPQKDGPPGGRPPPRDEQPFVNRPLNSRFGEDSPDMRYGRPAPPVDQFNRNPNQPGPNQHRDPRQPPIGGNGPNARFPNRPPFQSGNDQTQRTRPDYVDEWQEYSEDYEQSDYQQYDYSDQAAYNEPQQGQYDDPYARDQDYGRQFPPPNARPAGFPPRGPRPQQGPPPAQMGRPPALLQTPSQPPRFAPPRNALPFQPPNYGEQPAPNTDSSHFPPIAVSQGPDADMRPRDSAQPNNQRVNQLDQFQDSGRAIQEDADFRSNRHGSREPRRPPADVDNRRGRPYERERDYSDRDRERDRDYDRRDRDSRRRDDDYYRDRSRSSRDDRNDRDRDRDRERDRDRDRRDYSSGRSRDDRDQRSRDQFGRDRDREREYRASERSREESHRDRRDPSSQPGILGAAPSNIHPQQHPPATGDIPRPSVHERPPHQPVPGGDVPVIIDPDLRGLKRPHPDSQAPVTICVREVPYRAQFRDIHAFFRGCEIAYNGIKFKIDDNGRRTGVVYIKFSNPAGCQRALELDNCLLMNRYVKITTCAEKEFDEVLKLPPLNPENADAAKRPRIQEAANNVSEKKIAPKTGSDSCFVRLSSLPMTISKEDVRKFFANARIAKNGTAINFEYDVKGRTTGSGFVEFENVNEYQKALGYDGRELSSRRIRITPSTKKDVDDLIQRQQEMLKKPQEKRNEVNKVESQTEQQTNTPSQSQPPRPSPTKAQRPDMVSPQQTNVSQQTPTSQPNVPSQMNRTGINTQPNTNSAQKDQVTPPQGNPPSQHGTVTPQKPVTTPTKPPQNTPQPNTNQTDANKTTNQNKDKPQNTKSEAEKKVPNGGDGDAPERTPLPYYCVHVQCLPPFVVLKDVRDFFGGLEIVPRGIQIVYDSIGRPLGEAFVEFVTKTDCESAVQKDGEVLANHTIKVKPISKVDMIDYLRQAKTSRSTPQPNMIQYTPHAPPHASPHGPPHGPPSQAIMQQPPPTPYYARGSRYFYIRAHNLPLTISIREIMNFFQGYNPVEETIRVQIGHDPKSGGTTATLAFRTKEEADIAIASLTGKFYRNKQISLSPAFVQT